MYFFPLALFLGLHTYELIKRISSFLGHTTLATFYLWFLVYMYVYILHLSITAGFVHHTCCTMVFMPAHCLALLDC
jgi:hypothetical protein